MKFFVQRTLYSSIFTYSEENIHLLKNNMNPVLKEINFLVTKEKVSLFSLDFQH
jgi:hypothetical protein